ncbi:hypothetical protein M011DRAFT_406597 [Sporormia fimetaria CBS 119925]|uniref:DASH complex subunit DUO1 n=1 Tax=Sporormia fimetaria CBS 119925 TaxID=1340428 RepID=A0A6A6V7J3_9PLEO|nr:hypothetical protein M011DRAFT_406597 [Sporormia fimetaria CBS 119925]
MDQDHSDSDISDALFDTPAAAKSQRGRARDHDGDSAAPDKVRGKESHYTAEEAREAQLRQELQSVRDVNKVIEGVVESLKKARDNMDTVSQTVHNASTLLQTWTRILSQTEHNQRLILNPQWQGASQDLVDVQNEEVQRQQAAQRREAEEQARREAAARRADEERRKSEAPATRGGRGRVRSALGSRRGGTASSSSVGSSGQTGTGGGRGLGRTAASSTRAGSNIGRGMRGRSRGVGG